MDRAVDGFQFCRPVIFIARPHLGRDHSGSPAAVFRGMAMASLAGGPNLVWRGDWAIPA